MAAYRELPILECLNPLDAASPGLVFPYHEFEPFSFFDGATGRHATAAIDALAAWHAAFWRTSLDGFTDYAEVAVRQTIEARYDAAWAAERDRLLEWCPEFASLGDMLVGRLARTLEPMAEPRTLIHSDPHAENVPLSRDSAFLIDWEEPAFANPGLDLAVFMTMSFKEADRGRIERGSSSAMRPMCASRDVSGRRPGVTIGWVCCDESRASSRSRRSGSAPYPGYSGAVPSPRSRIARTNSFAESGVLNDHARVIART